MTTNPEDEHMGPPPWEPNGRCSGRDTDPPCKHETFSGVCMVCGAGPDEECGWEMR
jgi:hypothetical protein